jgi:predicted alpha/beta hydrolase
MKTIGHMGYFKKGAEQIWSKIRTTFDDLVQA